MRIEVRRMNNQNGYRISNGEKYVVVDNLVINDTGFEEYDNSEDLFSFVDSIEVVEAGDEFFSLKNIPFLPEGSLVTYADRVLIREEYCFLDLETREPVSHAYSLTVHRVGY